MKVALCLSGYFGTISTGDFSTGINGFSHIKEKILDSNDVDVFIHNWQPVLERNIKKAYSPKKSIFENQIDFKEICINNGINQEYNDENFPRKNTMYLNATFERILSFYYSRCKSLDICFEYQKEQSINYDWVIVSRFDIGQRGGSQVNQIKFIPSSETNFFYTAKWDQMNIGYGDMWHYSNPDIMRSYSKIYENALIDFKPNSEYENNLKTGWFDSNYFNMNDPTDQRQFTNEILKSEEQRSQNLMMFPKWRVCDSHLHHKWFSKKENFYTKTKWV